MTYNISELIESRGRINAIEKSKQGPIEATVAEVIFRPLNHIL